MGKDINDDITKMNKYMKLCSNNYQYLNMCDSVFDSQIESDFDHLDTTDFKTNDDILDLKTKESEITTHLNDLISNIGGLSKQVIIINRNGENPDPNNPALIRAKKDISNNCKLITEDVDSLKDFIKNLATLKTFDLEMDDSGIKLKRKLRRKLKKIGPTEDLFAELDNLNIEHFNIEDLNISELKNLEEFNIGSIVNPIIRPIKSGFNSIKGGFNKVKDTTTKIGKGIANATKKITTTVVRTITEQFKKIKDFFVNFGKQIVKIFKIIIKKFEELGKHIVRIGKIVANFGKTFYNKFLKPLFMAVFGAMKTVFEFIVKYVLPFLKKVIMFIIKEVPKIIIWIGKTTVRYFKNYYQTFLIAWLIFIGVYFGTQIYLHKLTGLQSSIPWQLLLIFSLVIMIDQVLNNAANLKHYQKKLVNLLISILRHDIVKKIFNLPPNFGRNSIPKDFVIFIKSFASNITRYIVFVLVMMFVVKFSSRYVMNKISESTGFGSE